MSERANKTRERRARKPMLVLLRGSNGCSTGRAATARPGTGTFLWGGVNQLVLFVAGPTPSPLPIWLLQTVVSSTHTPLQAVHTSLQTHTCLLGFIITSLSLKRTFHTLAPTVEGVVGSMPNNITHHATASLFTSIDDSAVVVEDYSALVQSGNGVEEVKGPQIPLKLQLRTISHLDLLNLL